MRDKFWPNQEVFYLHRSGRTTTTMLATIMGKGQYEKQWRIKLTDSEVIIIAQEEDLRVVPERDR